MAVREFIGMRVVPIIGRIGEDSFIWDGGEYEALTVVMTESGDTYISRYAVPANTPLENAHYWAKFASFNAQYANLQRIVESYSARIAAAQESAETANQKIDDADVIITELQSILSGFDAEHTVEDALSDVNQNVADVEAKIGNIPSEYSDVVDYIDGSIGDTNDNVASINETLTGFSPTNPVKPYIDNAVANISSRKKMVVIGDSLSGTSYVAANSRWCVILANRLNADLYVFSANGAGYAQAGSGGKTFQSLLTDAHVSNQFTDSDVDYLFIFGGTNDISEAMLPTAVSGAFDDTLDLARQYFANAEIYICTPTSRYDHLKLTPTTRRGEIYQLKSWRNRASLYTNNAILIPLTFITGFNENLYVGGESDHIHLNATGHAKLANAILNMMFGIPLATYCTCGILASDNTNVGTFRCSANANGLQVFGYTTNASGSENYIHDEFLVFKDAGFDNFWNGAAITGSNGGYIGGYNTVENGLHVVGYGGFNCYVNLT